MKDRLLISFFCLALLACSGREKVPEGVLPATKMQAVLWDMMRADQFLADYVFSRDTSLEKSRESIKLYRQIFQNHSITKEEFQQSMAWYRAHPAQFKTIMDSVSTQKRVGPADTTKAPLPQPVIKKDTALPKKGLRPAQVN